MLKIRFLAVLVLIVALAAPLRTPSVGSAEGDGALKGNLVNRTPGGAGVANQDVILKTYVGTQETGETSTKTDSQGRFEFSGLSTDSNYNYGLVVTYQEAEYWIGPKRFEQGSNVLNWEVPVYEATPKDDQIRIGRAHLIVNVRENIMAVLQYFSFVNTGDRTYVGSRPITPEGKKETIRLSLPTGAQQITSNEGLDECCAFRTDDGISDTLAVAPGPKDIVLSYELPYKSSAVYLDLPLYYPVDAINLLVGDQNVKVTSPQLKLQGSQDVGGQKYLNFSATSLPSGTELSIDLANLPQKGMLGGRIDANTLRWGGIGLAVLAIGFVVTYSLRRRPAAAGVASAERRRPDPKNALLRELAELDDRFASGQIREDEYERARDEKKQRLKDLMAPQDEV